MPGLCSIRMGCFISFILSVEVCLNWRDYGAGTRSSGAVNPAQPPSTVHALSDTGVFSWMDCLTKARRKQALVLLYQIIPMVSLTSLVRCFHTDIAILLSLFVKDKLYLAFLLVSR